MASILFKFQAASASLRVSARSYRDLAHRYYSVLKEPRQRNWHLAGHPAPISLVKADGSLDLSEDDDTPPPRVHRQGPELETPSEWRQHRLTLKQAFPDGWAPPRKLSREAMDGLRALHMYNPKMFCTSVLAERFKISPEAVRRILKSKWSPTREQRVRLAERERRSREERIMRSRFEEKRQKLSLLLEAAKLEKDNLQSQPLKKTDRSGKGINSRDKLFFQ